MDDDTDEKDDTKRKSRNLSEKKRRDQFNLLVNELSSMVSASSRKMDKSTVLKSTIAYLKHANDIAVRSRVHEIQEDWKPSFLSNEEFTHLILEALDGFIIVFSSNGRIFYTSESITSLLGHLPSDLLSSTIYDLAYEEDHSQLYNILLNPVCVIEPLQNVLTVENQISFSCHLKRGGLDYQEDVTYELVQFVGYFRSDLDLNKLLPNTRNSCYPGDTETHLIFVGTGRIQTPQLIREMSIVDSTKSEFTSRHSLEWKFLFLDHRAPPIIGYLPFEVLGTSGYDYYHFDDLEKVILCHDALMQKGEGKSCYYRFLTKGQQWIWLQSRFYITYHQWNSKPEFVVCTHRVVSHADVMKQMRNNSGHNSNSASGHLKEIVGSDCEEKLLQTTSPLMASSTWTSKSSRASRASATTSGLQNLKARSRHSTCHGTGSDSTSMSADSPSSRNSVMTQYSSRSRMRQNNIQLQQKLMQNQNISGSASHQSCASNYNSPSLMHSHPSLQSVAATPIIDSTFLEPQQYIAAIPLQPVIAPAFNGPAVLSTIPVSTELLPPGMVMTTNQSHIQDQLQRKHEELQKLIVQQQEELRRVSEQLLMARYGLLPPTCQLLNGSITYNNIAPNNPNRILNPTEEQHQLQQRNLIIQQHQHHQNHHHHQISDTTLHSNIINHDLSLASTGLDHQSGQNLDQQQNQEQIDPIIHTTQSTAQEDEMTSYLQLTTVPSSSHSHIHEMRISEELSDIQDHIMNHHNTNTPHHHHHHHHHHQQQQLQIPNELEILPYQMSTEQSHLLFSSPNSSRHSQ